MSLSAEQEELRDEITNSSILPPAAKAVLLSVFEQLAEIPEKDHDTVQFEAVGDEAVLVEG